MTGPRLGGIVVLPMAKPSSAACVHGEKDEAPRSPRLLKLLNRQGRRVSHTRAGKVEGERGQCSRSSVAFVTAKLCGPLLCEPIMKTSSARVSACW